MTDLPCGSRRLSTRMIVAELYQSKHARERQFAMNHCQISFPPQRFHERAPRARRIRAVIVICCAVILAIVISTNALGQQRVGRAESNENEFNAPNSAAAVSTREQVARALETLRSGKAEVPIPEDSSRPKELFLDLTVDAKATDPDSQSPQAMAASLDVSMTSSPTQVLMRAVAWIAIVLCVCCLIVLSARHWQRRRGLLPTTTARSKVLETLSLGPSRTVSLIEMHGYRALVASDATGIRSLVLAPSSFEETIENEISNSTER